MDHRGFSDREDVGHVISASDVVDAGPGEDASDGDTNVQPSGPVSGLPKKDVEYKMDHDKRGVALIFHHKEFGGRLPKRIGTESDRERVREMLERLRFNVKCHNDLELSEIERKLQDVASQEHGNHDCVAVVVLTHSRKEKKGETLAARDKDYDVSKLYAPFIGKRCRGLRAKPKLFFIQACEGKELAKRGGDYVDGWPDALPPRKSYRVPSYADFLIWYATFEGQYASDKQEDLSCCVRCLCSVLEDREASVDLLSRLAEVNRKVEELGPQNNGRVQVPCFTSSLTQLLYFR